MTTENRPHCFDRPPYVKALLVQDGYRLEYRGTEILRLPRVKSIPWAFTDECKASSSGEAVRLNMNCRGCKWESKPL